MPGYRTDSGYDFYLLAKDAPPGASVVCLPNWRRCSAGRQIIFSAYHDGQALCKSEVNVTVEDTAVQLHLRDCTLQSLADADDDLQGFLCAELQHAFAALTNDAKADFSICNFGMRICMAWEGKHRHPLAIVLSVGGVLDALPSHIHAETSLNVCTKRSGSPSFYCIVDGREI